MCDTLLSSTAQSSTQLWFIFYLLCECVCMYLSQFIVYCLPKQITQINQWENVHLLKKKKSKCLLRMFFFAVRNNWCAWKVISMNWGRVFIQSPPPAPRPPREMLVCLLKLFYVALSWRQIRPHERAIMPPLVAAALRISASPLLTQPGSPGREAMRTCGSFAEEPKCRSSDFELETLRETFNASLIVSNATFTLRNNKTHQPHVLVFGSTFITLWQGLEKYCFSRSF